MMNGKLCPLLMLNGKIKCDCVGNLCAWWVEGSDSCAMELIAEGMQCNAENTDCIADSLSEIATHTTPL